MDRYIVIREILRKIKKFREDLGEVQTLDGFTYLFSTYLTQKYTSTYSDTKILGDICIKICLMRTYYDNYDNLLRTERNRLYALQEEVEEYLHDINYIYKKYKESYFA